MALNNQSALTAGLEYLASNQATDGSFLGQASLSRSDFSQALTHQTSFFTSLIIGAIADIPAARPICQPATSFIASQTSTNGSWNYWIRDSVDDQKRPYPDDLDDTALALSALTAVNKTLVDGKALGALGRLLVSQETAVGGPYRTWLVSSDAVVTWRDVDLAVNANIGYLLSQHQVAAPGITDLVTQAVRSDQLTSRYYDGPIPVLYFVSRWYRGPALADLQKLLLRFSRKVSPHNALHLSLLLSACSYACLRPPLHLRRQLLSLQQADGSWPAASLYYEPPIKYQSYYAGSAALTTALALEALALLQAPRPKIKKPTPVAAPTPPATHRSIRQTLLQKYYTDYLKRLEVKDSAGQITSIATITAAACGQSVAKTIVTELNQASLNGWASYTLFDDLFDGDSGPSQLAVAMLALRRTVRHFHNALPASGEFQELVRDTLDAVDTANHWEQYQARAIVESGRIVIGELPDYQTLQQLADRSLGHCLASSGVLSALGLPVNHADQIALRDFFRHYLIARQLHDDAHDWQMDLANGQLSAVVCRLLQAFYGRQTNVLVTLDEDLPDLKRHFWESTIITIIEDIEYHIAAARRALELCQIICQPVAFTAWLDRLAAGADQVKTERTKAQAFIAGYARLA